MTLAPSRATSMTAHTPPAERVRPSRTHALEELFPLGLELGQSDESDPITVMQTAHHLCVVPVSQPDRGCRLSFTRRFSFR